MSNKRKFDEEISEYDESIFQDAPNQLMIQDNLYDTGADFNKPVDIAQEIQGYKEFVHELGYKRVFFTELGHPDPAKRDSPMFDGTITKSGNGNSFSVGVYPSICNAQVFPDIVNVHPGKSFYMMMPFKVDQAFMHPLGNYKRQMPPNKDGTKNPYHPQKPDEIRTKLKFSLECNDSAAGKGFGTKDPVSVEALRYLSEMETQIAKICEANKKVLQDIKLGEKFRLPGVHNFSVTWAPFRELKDDEDKSKIDFTPIHEAFTAFQGQQEHEYRPPPMFRVNPLYRKQEGAEPLINVPPEEQHIWEQPGYMVLVVFKMPCFAGKKNTLSCYLHHTIALGPGYHGIPGPDWIDQAKDLPVLMTPEELKKRPQNPAKKAKTH